MTVATTNSQATLQGNGATTVFNFGFVWVSSSTIQVYYTDISNNTTLIDPSNYVLTLNPVSAGLWGIGGTVTYNPGSVPIPTGTSLTIARAVPEQQNTSISNQGASYPTAIEQALDLLAMQIQQLAARTGQFKGEWGTAVNYIAGDIIIDGANGTNTSNYYSASQSNLSGTWVTDLAAGYWIVMADISGLNALVTAAAASASAAAASATAATTQATNAAASATAATTQATNAAASATAATTQATNAAASAIAATTQATNAAASATAATTQATNAAASAVAAAASAAVVNNNIVTLTASATPNVDLSAARNFFITVNQATTFSFSNPDVTGKNCSFVIFLLQDGTGETISWPGAVKWSNGIVPVLTTANALYTLTFTTRNGGNSYYGYLTGEALA